MDYKDVVEFLFTQYPSYQTKGVDAYKPDLSNIEGICEILDNPQKKIKTIHVAGTNGKGSVCNILYNLYKKAGYKVGLFTSPHLIDFRERIIVGEDEISKEYVVNFYKENLERFKKISPSFFEWSTALAFCYFKDSNTEINIIETGLGGRLDSTNIIQPELSIITSIGLDHVAILGDTLEKIAKEKAGIIKENTPTLLGADILEESVFREICNWKNSKLHKAVNKNDGIQTSLPNFQIKNWNTAKKATEILKNKFKISEIEDDPKKFLTIKGRWQLVGRRPLTILDIGHNEQCIVELRNQLKKETFEKLILIIGFSKDKDISTLLNLLPKAEIYYFTKSSNERSIDPEILKTKFNKENTRVCHNYKEAFNGAQKVAKQEDLVLITGSAFLIGDILKEFY
ncbi:MAG: folylpolyglutamate synthase/dihydrofolate synthase family protein [Flavobacteriales bacterium]